MFCGILGDLCGLFIVYLEQSASKASNKISNSFFLCLAQDLTSNTVKSKLRWDSRLTTALIDAVRVRPELWDLKHPDYGKRGRHYLLQQQIVDALKEAYPQKAAELKRKGE